MAGIGHWYIEIKKQSYWRGAVHTWVNRYVMSGSDPSASDATTVINALHTIENQIHPNFGAGLGVGFVEAAAYRSTGGAPFVVVPYNVTLAAATATGFSGPSYTTPHMAAAPTLEVCLGIRTKLNGVNSRGKPMYLRKFIRGVTFTGESEGSSTPINGSDITGIQGLVAPWWTGMGANNWVVISPKGTQAAAAPIVEPYLVNHQIPRGRKKKSTSNNNVLTQVLNGIGAAGGGVSLGEAIASVL